MRFGICASYADVLTLNARPFDYLEENVQRFLLPEQPQEVFEEQWRQARTLSLPIEMANSMLPASLPLIETPTQHIDKARIERYVKTALQRAEQVGIRVIVFGSGDARRCPADGNPTVALQQVKAHFATWCEWARSYSVRLALEPLGYEETNVVNTITEGGALVSEVAASGATLLVDTYHMACNGESPADILPLGPFISHVHVAEKQERAAPGRYNEDLRPYFAMLHKAGYDARISIECRWKNLAEEVVPAFATLRKQWMAGEDTGTAE